VQPVSTPTTATDEGHDSDRASDGDHAQGNLELFFDLVFVFAMSQVTQLMLNHLTWVGFGRACSLCSRCGGRGSSGGVPGSDLP
jgi:low temperature requirement protein LtrA